MNEEEFIYLFTIIDGWKQRGFLDEEEYEQLYSTIEMAAIQHDMLGWFSGDAADSVKKVVEEISPILVEYGVPVESIQKLAVWARAEVSVSDEVYEGDPLKALEDLLTDVGQDVGEALEDTGEYIKDGGPVKALVGVGVVLLGLKVTGII